MRLVAQDAEALFTDNETNFQRVFGSANNTAFQKDGIGRYTSWTGKKARSIPLLPGTKAAFHYQRTLQPGETYEIELRLTSGRTGEWGAGDGV